MIALIVLLGATAVYGQHGHGHQHSCIHGNIQNLKENQVVTNVINDMDKDGDGVVAPADVLNEFITNYDHDGDGKVGHDEFVKQWHQTYHDVQDFAAYLFHHFDRNDDLFLTREDLTALAPVVDTNGDGKTSATEFTVYLTKLYTECVAWPGGH